MCGELDLDFLRTLPFTLEKCRRFSSQTCSQKSGKGWCSRQRQDVTFKFHCGDHVFVCNTSILASAIITKTLLLPGAWLEKVCRKSRDSHSDICVHTYSPSWECQQHLQSSLHVWKQLMLTLKGDYGQCQCYGHNLFPLSQFERRFWACAAPHFINLLLHASGLLFDTKWLRMVVAPARCHGLGSVCSDTVSAVHCST